MIHSSTFWKNHFQFNLTKQRIDWSVQPSITDSEKDQILYSLKAWQLGETSDGRNLLAACQKYADSVNDLVYVDAMKLFIKEEQKHGNNLGKYLDAINEPRLKKDWGDSLFRKVRGLNRNMEIWTITVIIVESAAQLFYKSLHDATKCELLKAVCNDILIDEAHHIKFQNERLFILFRKRNYYLRLLTQVCYSVLFFATIHAIWFSHKKAFIAGNVNRKTFMEKMTCKFFKSMQFLHSSPAEEAGELSSIVA